MRELALVLACRYEAEFKVWSAELDPVPEYLLPDSFVEWGVEVKGFEHLCSSSVFNEGHETMMMLRQNRLLPSVGCGVDAVPTEVRTVNVPLSKVMGSPSGSFFVGPEVISPDAQESDNWSCGLATACGETRRRVRIEGAGFGKSLRKVKVWIEEYLCNFQPQAATSRSRESSRAKVAFLRFSDAAHSRSQNN